MSDPNRPRTVMETDDEIRAALLESNASGIVSRVRTPQVPPEPVSTDRAPSESSTAQPFRPTVRPPTPLLIVCDDGDAEGETVRLRADKFVLGRTTGDLLLPHDGLVSGRHIEITRSQAEGRWCWLITDLRSTHGTYFRFSSHQLADQTEFLVGRSRFRFEYPKSTPAAAAGRTDYTIGWSDENPPATTPTLVEVARTGVDKRMALVGECWIGSDPSCSFAPADDPFLEPRHAKIRRHPKRGWVVENNRTQNGVWVRREQYVFDPSKESQGTSIRFQIGEQQLKLMVPT